MAAKEPGNLRGVLEVVVCFDQIRRFRLQFLVPQGLDNPVDGQDPNAPDKGVQVFWRPTTNRRVLLIGPGDEMGDLAVDIASNLHSKDMAKPVKFFLSHSKQEYFDICG